VKRGAAQVIFRYTPGAIFKEKGLPWCRVTYLELRPQKRRYPGLMRALKEYLQPWLEATPSAAELWPDPIEKASRYAVGVVERVIYEAFPLVLKCLKCERMHWYNSTRDFAERNPTASCEQGCIGENLLRQYPYAFIHPVGDIQPLVAPKNLQGNYLNIRMYDTGKFKTSFWMGPDNKRLKPTHGDGLGLRVTRTPGWTGSNAMRGIHLGQPEKFYSHSVSVVDIDDERLIRRMEHPNFGEIQLGSYLKVSSFKPDEYAGLFEQTLSEHSDDPFLKVLESKREFLPPEHYAELLAQYQRTRKSRPGGALSDVVNETRKLIPDPQVVEQVRDDTSLNEYLYCRYELEADCCHSLDSLYLQAEQQGDTVNIQAFSSARKAAMQIGVVDLMLHEQFPILLAGVGFSRDSWQPGRAILRPFASKQDDEFQRFKIPIPITATKNEAMMFALDPCRVVAFLKANKLAVTAPDEALANQRVARAWLYQYIPKMKVQELSKGKLGKWEQANAAILVFRLLHTMTHLIMHAGKKYVGLEMDSLAEFLFPSAMASAIYVSKHTQFSLGALVTTFRHDLARWLISTKEAASSCLFDPVCRNCGGACHACTYLKFSCQYHNHGLNRGLLLGSRNLDGWGPVVGYWSPVVDEILRRGSVR